jgi:hypothetical protein
MKPITSTPEYMISMDRVVTKKDKIIAVKVIAMLKDGCSWTEIFDDYLLPELNLTKTQAFSFINGIANDKNADAEKCQNLGFVKGSTTRAQRSYTTS